MAVAAHLVSQGTPKRSRDTRRLLVEVQALRMVAVALVVIYHVWPDRLPGGFVGVDVFFVISGFLITSHLLREVQKTGSIDVGAFWARRIRRLLPASLLVLMICAVLLWTVYPPVFRWPGIEQIAFAGVYLLNWLLGANAVDYLHAGDSATLVQHFWSLSIEEQFYVLWPLLVLAALWSFARIRRGARSAAPATAVLVVAAVVVVASFIYSVLLSHYQPAFAYFDTGTRAWELGLGALFAAFVTRWSAVVERFRAVPAVSRAGIGTILGLAVIIASAFFIGPDMAFPGWVAIFPTVGALCVIVCGLPDDGWLRPIIAWRPVQYIGDVSYELYLVHWPLIVTALVVTGVRPGTVSGVLYILVAVVLAAALHWVIGRLPRIWPGLWAKRRVAFALAACGAVVLGLAAAGTLAWQRERIAAASSIRDELIVAAGAEAPGPNDPLACVGAAAMLSGAACEDRFELTDATDLSAAALDLDRENWCLTWYDQDWLQCERGDRDATNGTIALVGDSHAGAWTGAMDSYFAAQGWKVVTYTRFGCTGLERPIPELAVATDAGKMWQDCVTWSERVRADIAGRDDVDAVLMTNWQLANATPSEPGLPARLTPQIVVASLQELAAGGKAMIYLEDPPNTVGEPVPECLAAAWDAAAPCATVRSERFNPELMVNGIAESGLDVAYLPTVDAYCDADTCYSVIGGVVVYTDDNHISDTWARSLMPYVGPQIIDAIAARGRA